MIRITTLIILLVLCFSLAACGKTETVMENEPDKTQILITDEKPTESIIKKELSSYSFAHAAEIYADPDAYTGKKYASPFNIISEKQQVEANTMYYANGYIKNGGIRTLTVLDFKDSLAVDLSLNQTVYVYGIIQGKGFVADEAGNHIDLLWLEVTDIELDAGIAHNLTENKEYSFESGEYFATDGMLTIEIMSLNFSRDMLSLNTKTVDSSVKKMTTYYFDIIIHQDGYFAWYNNCNFWIQPDSISGYDGIPMPVMSSAKDMTIEFVPFSENGKLLYEPLVIDVKLSK